VDTRAASALVNRWIQAKTEPRRLRVHRRDVDDVTSTASFDHEPSSRLVTKESTGEVDFQHSTPLLGIELESRLHPQDTAE
jgi:hypothetical protein